MISDDRQEGGKKKKSGLSLCTFFFLLVNTKDFAVMGRLREQGPELVTIKERQASNEKESIEWSK